MTMKYIKSKEKLLSYTIFGIALLSMSAIVPAYAASSISFGPWTTKWESPSFAAGTCTGASNACASAASVGTNKVIARSTFGLFDGHDAYADNNQEFSGFTVGSSPQLTSSSATVFFSGSVTYNGQHTVASGATNYYQPRLDMWKLSGGSWNPIGGCLGSQISGSGSHISSTTVNCSQSNSGSNSYRMGIEHHVGAWNPGAGTTIVDYWNSPRKAQTDSMSIFD